LSEPKPGAESARSPQQPASPAEHAQERISDLLFQWETRNLTPVRRRAVAFWRRSRGSLTLLATGALLVVLGAAVAAEPDQPVVPPVVLNQRLLAAEGALAARTGELELARLELNRLSAIVAQSSQHRIPADLATSIYDIAIAEGLDPALAFSLVRVESGFTRRAISSAGAVGLTQVMPSTAFWLQPGVTYSELFEPHTNLRLGFRYLRLMLEQYNGDLHLALLAYNRGPNKVDDILRRGGNPSNGYEGLVRSGMRRPSE
jgi:soluble lytic murein transglycosylase-like protein